MSQGIEMRSDSFNFGQLKKNTETVAYVGLIVSEHLLFDHNKKEKPMPDLLYQDSVFEAIIFYMN